VLGSPTAGWPSRNAVRRASDEHRRPAPRRWLRHHAMRVVRARRGRVIVRRPRGAGRARAAEREVSSRGPADDIRGLAKPAVGTGAWERLVQPRRRSCQAAGNAATSPSKLSRVGRCPGRPHRAPPGSRKQRVLSRSFVASSGGRLRKGATYPAEPQASRRTRHEK